jgi:tRNA-specific 2-thiouridylase
MSTEKKQKVLVAMSGGVDSAVAALLALRMGYDCTGVTMRLIPDGGSLHCACDDGKNIYEDSFTAAERAAKMLGIPHQVLDFRDEFETKVIRPFIGSYLNGSTPNPCIDCNTSIKFSMLYKYALENGFEKLVTGHYAKIVTDGEYLRLARAAHPEKDQSYFLYRLQPDTLLNILFPLGNLSKKEVRDIALEANLECAERGESQDICFIPEDGHAAFIEDYLGEPLVEGVFVDSKGRVLGRHSGISHFTIGQRKGLGIALGKPVFVKEIRPRTNEVVLADEEELFVSQIELEEVLLYSDLIPRAQAVIRYRAKPVWADIKQEQDGRLFVSFDKPVRAPAKGQAAVLYFGDIIIGGGRII